MARRFLSFLLLLTLIACAPRGEFIRVDQIAPEKAALAPESGVRETIFVGIALAISVIPEGLPVAVTVALSIAARRMARRNVIVRHLPAVEGLGASTVIATDKTGTLTVNQLTARRLWLPAHGVIEISGEGLSPEGAFSTFG